jgi:hypothetical protein
MYAHEGVMAENHELKEAARTTNDQPAVVYEKTKVKIFIFNYLRNMIWCWYITGSRCKPCKNSSA